MTERLGWRMVGALCLVQMATCDRWGAKYPDFSFERITFALCDLFWLWMAFKAWRREFSAAPSSEGRDA